MKTQHEFHDVRQDVTFDDFYTDAYMGDLPEDFEHYHLRSDNDEADHPFVSLLHIAAKAGHLPSSMEDDDDPRWLWEAGDGWSVRDAWEEWIEDSRAF
jgi:hypothetical protein